MTTSNPAVRRPRRGGGKALRRVIIGVLVLVVLLVVADRVGDYVAQDQAAKTLQTSQDLPNEPDVDIGGFPFLTQLASRDFDQITITATDIPIGGDDADLSLSRLKVTLDKVTFPRDFSSVSADTAHAVGTIGYAELGAALGGVDLSYAGDGRVRASKAITVAGQKITPTVTAAPILVKGALSFGRVQANGLGALAGQLSDIAEQVFDVRTPLSGIPFDITVQKLSMDADGLRIDLTGSDLTYRKN